MREQKNIFSNIDWTTVLIYLALVFIGWINIYAAVYSDEHKNIFDISQNYGKQLVWIGASILLALIILFIDTKVFSAFSFLIYAATILLLIAVLFAGKEISGSKSWFSIGGFAFQPCEFAKFATNLVLAKYLSSLNINIKKFRTKLVSAVIIGIPAVLILLQNDTGSALVFFAFILILYREGMSGNVLIIGLSTIILFFLTILINKLIIIGIIVATVLLLYFIVKRNKKNIITLITIFILTSGFVFSVGYTMENILGKHQKERIEVLFGKKIDLKGAGYNINQSKIAIGSGGFFGKGFLRGTQTKYDFVPEQSTDFIFCTIGEEWGFFGSSIVIVLFVGLMIRLVFLAERQRSAFSRIYGYGVAVIIFFHFLINIGMTTGLAPVIGIPLPFFSYGGSSLWAFTILLFIFIRQDANRMQML